VASKLNFLANLLPVTEPPVCIASQFGRFGERKNVWFLLWTVQPVTPSLQPSTLLPKVRSSDVHTAFISSFRPVSYDSCEYKHFRNVGCAGLKTYYSFSMKSLRHRVSQSQSLVTQDVSFSMRHEGGRRTSVNLGLPTQKGTQTTRRLCKTYMARTFLHINGQTEGPKPLRVLIGFCRYVVKVLSVILALDRDCGCLHKR